VRIAKEACEAARYANHELLDLLAAAYAAAGDSPKAVAMAGKAIRPAEQAGADAQARAYRARFKLYKAGRSYIRGFVADTPPP
jgi:hypothetical protein